MTDEGEMLDKIDYVTHDRCSAAGGAAWASDALSPGGAESVASTGAYNVFAVPMESPYDGGRTLEVDLADALASPFGWHDTDGADGAEFMTTQGNNVHAYTDVDANNIPDPGSSPDGGGDLVFDFPLDLAQEPATYQPAAVTNLFYWNNVLHDVFYRYGLTGYHVAFDARTWPEWFGCSRSP